MASPVAEEHPVHSRSTFVPRSSLADLERTSLMQNLPWIIAVLAVALLAGTLSAGWVRSRRSRRPPPLPTDWALSPRPVFSADERGVYRLLREALPHHVVLAKLPLVRFCQPRDPAQVRFWYELLAGSHLSFAVCSGNGRVLAAIDLDSDRGNSRRAQQIKQSVLGACRIRYLRCPIDNLPTVAELQLLVPSTAAPARGNHAAPSAPGDLDLARDALSSTVASRRAQRSALWQDSTLFQDSFFAPDSRAEGFAHSGWAGAQLGQPRGRASAAVTSERSAFQAAQGPADEPAGVVVESQRASPSRH